MSFAIIRVEKIKTLNSVRRTLLHSFRNQETPNADPQLTAHNKNYFSKSFNEAMLKFHDCIPQKKARKDAVLLCEYVVTASPEFFHENSSDEINSFFTTATKFLVAKHGAKNIILASLHLDEATPHMHIYAVPITSDGRLSCKDFFGAPRALNKLQDEFYESIIKTASNLKRGIKNTKIRHTDRKEFANLVNSVINEDDLDLNELIRRSKTTKIGEEDEQKKAEQAFLFKIKAQQAKIAKLELDKKAADMRLNAARKIEEKMKLEDIDHSGKHSNFIESVSPLMLPAERFNKGDVDREYKPSRYSMDNELGFTP